MSTPPPKLCQRCGRPIEWRKKWERDWERVRYCSKSCRSAGVSPTDQALEDATLALLADRKPGAAICPSEAARAVAPDDWRPLIEPARMAARRLASQGAVEVTQGGAPVDPSNFRGPVRIRLSQTPTRSTRSPSRP